MTLESYITDLLYRYDCVIVPNFGGFVANAKSATVNANTFSPPYKQITFNSLLQNNDGLLANYIAQVDKVPYETAVNFISFKVQEWIDKLLDEELNLEGLGALFLTNDKIQFEPKNSINYLTSSFGLGKFNVNSVQRENELLATQKIPVLENKPKEYKEKVIALKDTTPIFVTPEKRRRTPNFIKYAAIFLLSASVLGLSNKMYQDNLEKRQIADYNKNKKIREAKIQMATFVIDAPLPTITLNTVISKNKIYHIIAGAFRNEKNANKKVIQLINQGFDAKIVGKNKWNLTQVAFTSYSDLETATIKLATIKKEMANDAWLLVKK